MAPPRPTSVAPSRSVRLQPTDPSRSGGQRFFDASDDGIEAGRIGNRHFRKRLAIQADLGLGQSVDKFAVAQTSLAAGGVEADDPQLAKLALTGAAVAKGKHAGA